MITLNEMRELLRSVPDSYEDFVSGMLDFHWDNPELRTIMYQYVKDHPYAHTDEIMIYMEQFPSTNDQKNASVGAYEVA